MTAEFGSKKIKRVVVDGNGECIYNVLDEKDNSFIGLNKIICSNITIRFKDGKAKNISFYVKPDGGLIPPHKLKEEDKTLQGFSWKEEQRPARVDVVNYSPVVKKTE